jgi:hypothetical protein
LLKALVLDWVEMPVELLLVVEVAAADVQELLPKPFLRLVPMVATVELPAPMAIPHRLQPIVAMTDRVAVEAEEVVVVAALLLRAVVAVMVQRVAMDRMVN